MGQLRNRSFSFGVDLDHPLDPGIFAAFFIIAIISISEGVDPWRRYALSQCSCF